MQTQTTPSAPYIDLGTYEGHTVRVVQQLSGQVIIVMIDPDTGDRAYLARSHDRDVIRRVIEDLNLD